MGRSRPAGVEAPESLTREGPDKGSIRRRRRAHRERDAEPPRRTRRASGAWKVCKARACPVEAGLW